MIYVINMLVWAFIAMSLFYAKESAEYADSANWGVIVAVSMTILNAIGVAYAH